jgi:hypothetical protein
VNSCLQTVVYQAPTLAPHSQPPAHAPTLNLNPSTLTTATAPRPNALTVSLLMALPGSESSPNSVSSGPTIKRPTSLGSLSLRPPGRTIVYRRPEERRYSSAACTAQQQRGSSQDEHHHDRGGVTQMRALPCIELSVAGIVSAETSDRRTVGSVLS